MTDEIVKIDPDYRLGTIPAETPHDVIVQATKMKVEQKLLRMSALMCQTVPPLGSVRRLFR